ncbi:DUF2213 domain-containing protein [Salmonella enterica]|nr:DUF2213 domain-containing protein [Salmonella enterica]EJH7438255.1 DUF2213 domain-containing protein [Salmonella enterica]EJH7877549.1 DUF2213 domain-containing protein [Salmonella enterica]EJI6710263.1 DUF2213 domain-containing protein [Salmonella enterica]
MKLSSIHVKSLAVNASNISTTTINGVQHYVIRGAVPIVDDIVLNGGLYPAEEINNSYQTMERKLMPIGHPMVNGKYVSANDPQAVNDYYAGAWAQNVSKANDKVVMDVYVNKSVADTKPDGKRLIQRLDDMISGNNADPIHVSTGLLLNKEQKAGESKQKKYSWVAHNMQFDHIAILLDEPGAGTPDEGVGMFVNADGQEADVEATSLIDAANSMKDGLLNKVKFFFAHNSDASFDEIYQMLREAIRAPSGSDVYRYVVTVWPDKFIYEEGNKLFQQKYLIDDSEVTLVGEPVEVVRKPTEYEVKTNGETNPMKEKMIAALNAAGVKTEGLTDDQVWDAYNEQMKKPADGKKDDEDPEVDKSKKKDPAANAEEIPAWAKALSEKVDALNTQISANADTERKEMCEAVKAKFGLSDTAVNAMADEPLKEMFSQCQTSLGLNGAFRQTNSSQSVSEMPE